MLHGLVIYSMQGHAQVKQHDWCRKSHPCNAPPVTITPRGDDPTLSTTVLPFLVELHLSADQDQELQDDYITEHDLHEHQRAIRDEAAAILHQGQLSRQSSSKTTKCIKVKKLTHCSVS